MLSTIFLAATKASSEFPAVIVVIGIVGIVVIAAYAFVCKLIADAAVRKGRSFWSWFFISFFVSPVLAAIIIAALSPAQMHGLESSTTGTAADLVPCPRCAEPIRPAANACRFCGTDLSR